MDASNPRGVMENRGVWHSAPVAPVRLMKYRAPHFTSPGNGHYSNTRPGLRVRMSASRRQASKGPAPPWLRTGFGETSLLGRRNRGGIAFSTGPVEKEESHANLDQTPLKPESYDRTLHLFRDEKQILYIMDLETQPQESVEEFLKSGTGYSGEIGNSY
ncbi:hypothetical protein P691DRAFT_784423 [Macrolepiota fuliginosa MF-IS2]|uniref:Uncharacterized protein n=1 Tax=Macrolepiota fuliginosa MF-IS2 TaxID=1400762 RepID=A0A9P5WYY0_9AGAR|nr:hypothetical protein P691DRAFT_784423 [Macrolepiota fuliginosa MF-IS2]